MARHRGNGMSAVALSKDARIVIVGAGPAGLSVAYYLKLRGYTNVILMEKEQRVGGLCLSLTVDNQSFDLGANFVTKAYTELMALARKYNQKMYSEKPFGVMNAPPDRTKAVKYNSLFNQVRQHDDGSTTNLLVFSAAVFKYMWIRWRLSPLIDQPTFGGVAAHPELCVPFDEWLTNQKLFSKDLNYYLSDLFQVPITMMGYGQLKSTAAPYALKYMTLATFWPMVLKSIPHIGTYLTSYPKRFEHGFQRLWETMSWDLNVRTGIGITSIDRSGAAGITIEYTQWDQNLDTEVQEADTYICDALILACPLMVSTLEDWYDLSDAERKLFEKVSPNDYCMTTRMVKDLGAEAKSILGDVAPLLCVLPEDDRTLSYPWAIAQAREDSDFVQFYTRINPTKDETIEEIRATVLGHVDELLQQMSIDAAHPPIPLDADKTWHTFDRWTYFQHVHPEDFAAGWYDSLNALQGTNNTWYVGGVTNFELIEPIMGFSRGLVEAHFPGNSLPKNINWRRIFLAVGLAGLLALFLILPLRMVPLTQPVSDLTPEAQASTQAFWDAFHGQQYSQLPTIIGNLEKAYATDADDPIVTSLLGAAYLWKFQERRRVNGVASDYRSDLEKGIQYANETLALSPSGSNDMASTFAPAIQTVGGWQLAIIDSDDASLARAQLRSLENTQDVPEFDGFVQGWLASTLHPKSDPRFQNAKRGYNALMTACAGFQPPRDQVFNPMVMSYLSIKSLIQPKFRVCYANPVAPHNLEGYFLAAGDWQVKAGEFELAKISYGNAKRMPTYDTWPFQDTIEQRLASDFSTLQKTFEDQSGKLDIAPSGPAMSLQSGMGCASCHASK
jgi:hypothetical protein